ncbi:Crp/Fnr family transcriptional regulator [Aurantimonas sp. C2-6-R+9]|uniref:Crp/Fnr family transcriptional regulator n=1 Tax=unclassified Aurantimonas TaxID=2638230 RepID=UPI002E198007|nr:Crp/Fnr family transcriptional regulator [Aurantimonas sp. C2-6-R+9]
MTEALLEIKDNHNILSYLTDTECQQVLSCATRQLRKPGEHIFVQGEPHEGIFLIRSGSARTYYASSTGREITLAHWTAGHFVGGPEIFGGGLHVWSATALEECEIAFLAARDIRRLMIDLPKLTIGLVDGLVYKGKCYSALLQILGTRSAVGRLAHLLLTLAEREGVLHDAPAIFGRQFSHEELANMIGATRQWVTVSLKRFEKAGIVTFEKHRIVILDKARLRQTAFSE